MGLFTQHVNETKMGLFTQHVNETKMGLFTQHVNETKSNGTPANWSSCRHSMSQSSASTTVDSPVDEVA